MQLLVFILGYFLPLYPHSPSCPPIPCIHSPNSPKNQNFEKMKKYLETSSFYKRVPKTMIINYTVPEIMHMWQMLLLFFILAYFLPFYPPTPPQQDQKNFFFKKNKKNLGIPSFDTRVPKMMIRWYTVPEIWCMTNRQMEGQRVRWKKWHLEGGSRWTTFQQAVALQHFQPPEVLTYMSIQN